MPRTSKTGRRRMGRRMPKSTLAKAKRVLGKQMVNKAKKNMDTHFVRCKQNVSISPIQGGTVANYISAFFPLYTTGSQYVYDVRKITDFIVNTKLYDRFRINRVTVKFTPKANVLDQFYAQADGALELSGTGMMHTAIDRDGSVPVAIDAFRKYSSYKQFSLLKPFTRSYSVRWPRGMWLDCDEFISSDTQVTRTIGCSGGISIYAENILEELLEGLNEPLGNIEVTYDVVFEGKTYRSTTLDASGNVILSAFTDKEVLNGEGMIALVGDGK